MRRFRQPRLPVSRKTVAAVLALIVAVTAVRAYDTFFPSRKSDDPPAWSDYYELGMSLYDAQSYKQAAVAFKIAISIDPSEESAYIMCGECYSRLGMEDKASKILAEFKG